MKPPSKSSSPVKRSGYAIELSFDAETDRTVRQVWAELGRAGVCNFMSNLEIHPHISFAIYDALEPPRVEPLLLDFARTQRPLPITLSPAGVFSGGGGVVFFGAVVTEELLRVHRDLHERLRASCGEGWSYYNAAEWVPHCTLTQDMPEHFISRAIEIAHRAPTPIRGRLESVHLVEFYPPVVLFSAPLA